MNPTHIGQMKNMSEVLFNFCFEKLTLNFKILLQIIVTVPILEIDSLVTIYFRLSRAVELYFTVLYFNQCDCERIACYHKGNVKFVVILQEMILTKIDSGQ